MLLYLVQHAEAKSEAEDPQRDLAAKGLRDIQKTAAYLGKLKLPVRQILHSGKTRALSTARVLAEALQPPQGIAASDGLAPLDDAGIWAARLAEMPEDLMLVGHLPHLGKLAALLVSGDPEKAVVNFKMAGVVCLRRLAPGEWVVEWLIIPEVVL
ncbi:MAG: phosphohistidine phosphatase SixA [Deltaproteobacteria bacterium]|nr:phosphohistidine phosphatase SixA [Deltaproteobacteria bacterium]